jgi:hypothetical protein
MDIGGTAIIPLPEKRPHTDQLTPDFPLVLWPYTDLADPRFRFTSRYITVTQDTSMPATKLGLASSQAWAGYLLHGKLFVKYFDYMPEATYPDFGCNFEVFSNEEILEIESIGPLTSLAPGESVEHVETWRLFADIPIVNDEEAINRFVLPLVTR